MKYFLILLLLNSSLVVYGQQKITKNDKYAIFCRVYGLVKYYANDVVDGKVNWDSHTVNYLSKLDTIDNLESFNKLLTEYLSIISCRSNISQTLIDIDKIKKKHKLKNIESRISFIWIENAQIAEYNREKLKAIISAFEFRKNISFQLEEKRMLISHKSFFEFENNLTRHHYLLGYFQVWNVVEYFFPYKYLMDKSWDEILLNTVAAFSKIEDRREYWKRLRFLTSSLDDSHVKILDEEYAVNDKWHPISFAFCENKIVLFGVWSDSLINKHNIKKGDVLTHINGISLDSIFNDFIKETSNSNLITAKRHFVDELYKQKILADSVCFTFNDSIPFYSQKLPKSKFNQIEKSSKVSSFRDIDKNTGFIDTRLIGYRELGKAMKRFKHKKNIIIDCRNYADIFVLRFGTLFGGKPKNVSSIKYPLFYLPGYYSEKQENYFGSTVQMGLKLLGVLPSNAGNIFPSFKKPYQGRVIVLMNEKAISFGETSIMTIKTYAKNCVLIGTNTAGANGNVSTIRIIGGVTMGYSGIDFSFANGAITQRKGIVPDIVVNSTIADFQNGIDTVLKYAIDYCQNN